MAIFDWPIHKRYCQPHTITETIWLNARIGRQLRCGWPLVTQKTGHRVGNGYWDRNAEVYLAGFVTQAQLPQPERYEPIALGIYTQSDIYARSKTRSPAKFH